LTQNGLWLSKRSLLSSRILGLAEVAEADTHQAKPLVRAEADTSRNDRAIFVSSSQETGGEPGMRLRVRILNSLVFSFRPTMRAM
jgi:hypothetical protein